MFEPSRQKPALEKENKDDSIHNDDTDARTFPTAQIIVPQRRTVQ